MKNKGGLKGEKNAMEDRLDRIEKGIEALFKGIDKLRQSQKGLMSK